MIVRAPLSLLARAIVATWLLCMAALPAQAAKVALVLGNGNYQFADPLRNATNDATDMAARLRELGFTVFDGINLTRVEALRLVQQFAAALTPSDTALFYFAGHGMQLGSDNYIMPVDAVPGTEAELTESAIRLQSILATMENAADTRIIILDACRNNPFIRGTASRAAAPNRGFMRMEAGVGSFIAFSTEPGNVANDGTGRNSPFTEALLRHIGTPGADIHAVMRAVRSDVITVSNRTQTPWENSALIDEVFLAPRPDAPAVNQPAVKIAAPPPAPAPMPAMPAARAIRSGEICLTAPDRRFCVESALSSQQGNQYGPQNLFDNVPATAWVEGVQGTGEGQRLSFDFAQPRDIAELYVMNGYAKTEQTYTRNARVRQLRLTGSSGATGCWTWPIARNGNDSTWRPLPG